MKLRLSAVLILSVASILMLGAWLAFAQTTPTEGKGVDLAPLSARRAWNIELVGQLGGAAKAVASQGGLAFVATGPRLVIVDISDPANPVQVGSYEMPLGHARDVAVAGGFAYIAGGEAGLHIVDVSTVTNPVEAGSSAAAVSAWAVDVAGDYAYVADAHLDRMHIIDVSDPTSPTLESTYTPSIQDTVRDVSVALGAGQTHAYLGCSFHLFIVDVTNPSGPSELGTYPTAAHGVAPVGGLIFVAAGGDGLHAIDVSSPGTPTLLDTLDTPGAALAVTVSGTHAYVADWSDGLRIVDISTPGTLSEDSFYDTPGSAEDVAVAGNYVLVADEARGLRVVDVSVPGAPVEEGAYDVPSEVYTVAVSGTLAYVGDYYYAPTLAPGALRVVDVSDPAHPAQVAFADLSGRSTGLALAGHYAYLSGYAAGLLVVDVFDPSSPNEVTSYPTTKLANDVAVAGSHAYLADDWDLYLFDISNPTAPVLLSTWPAPGYTLSSVAVAGHYAYVGTGSDGLRVVNVSNPLIPVETGVYTVTDDIYDVAVLGDRVYVAAHSEGLHIVDISNPASPTLAGLYGDEWDVIVVGVAVAESDSGQVLAYIVGEIWDGDQWHDRLSVLDVSDPASPVEVGYYNLLTEGYTAVVAEDDAGRVHIYFASRSGGLMIFRFGYHLFLPVVLHNWP